MRLSNLSQYRFFLLTVAALVKLGGSSLASVFDGEKTFLDWLLRPLERWIYRLARVDLQHEMSWRIYTPAHSFFLASPTQYRSSSFCACNPSCPCFSEMKPVHFIEICPVSGLN